MFPSRTGPPALNLKKLPPTYLLPAHLTPERLHELREKLLECNCPLTDVASDACLFIADVNTRKRCELELRKKDIAISDSASQAPIGTMKRTIRVVKLAWLTTSLEKRKIQDFEAYTVLRADVTFGARRSKTFSSSPIPLPSPEARQSSNEMKRKGIMDRAKADALEAPSPKRPRSQYGSKETSPRSEKQAGVDSILAITKRPPLKPQSTSSFEGTKAKSELPEWIRTKNTYSCCRSTPLESPNELFISQLKVIKHTRLIGSDQIGIRSYATAIAAIKAYPYELSSGSEIMALPGCSKKIAGLFEEWQASSPNPEQRKLTSVKELEESETYQVLKKFESIWGVGADTATKLYYTHGYRTIGDIISKHWNQLTRVQQIGVKYYDEFLTPIPRREMEKIAALITSHAEAILPGVQTMIVGGYRRGKKESGDVDVLLSHPVEGAIPSGFLINLLQSLENAELITHTLTVSTPSEKPSKKKKFDGLDKAMLVWQTKQGRLHRRVDIIVAPAVCAGTALLGWTGGTTFERDLRLYCDKERGWKLSSEGVWQGSQRVPGTEGWREGESWEDVEKRVLETIGVGWRPPAERCTE